MGMTEGVFNSNTDNRITLEHLWESYPCYWMVYERSALRYDDYIFLVMSAYFWCRPLHFWVMYVSYVVLMNGTVIIFWVSM